jgi:23S rRNA (cytosine1962-C5)-methyltransferase
MQPQYPTLTVNGYSERWLKTGFCWVYPKEVLKGKLEPGAIVALCSARGEFLGVAIADDGWIAARRFRVEPGALDEEWLKSRLETALALRKAVLPPATTAWRLLHAENDAMPGVRVDIYGEHAVISLDSPGLQLLVPLLVRLLPTLLSVQSIHLEYRPDPRDKQERNFKKTGCLWGKDPESVVVEERGLKARVYPGRGKDIGIYPDMREIRYFLEPGWKGMRVLNLFAHTGFFSVAAAKNGAASVVTVDLSEKYLSEARENFRLNGLPVEESSFLAEDSFKVLDRFRRQKVTFDRIVADPPGYSHSEAGAWSGEKDYPRLVAACLAVAAKGAWLICASNLGSISPKQFQGFLEEGARRAGRRLVLIHEGTAAPDFPAALEFPESRYLKAWVLAVE